MLMFRSPACQIRPTKSVCLEPVMLNGLAQPVVPKIMTLPISIIGSQPTLKCHADPSTRTSGARSGRIPRSSLHGAQRRGGTRFSAHSTRLGAAQDAKAAGASTGAIQQAGGWKSERMVGRYTEKLAAKESAAAMLAMLQGR